MYYSYSEKADTLCIEKLKDYHFSDLEEIYEALTWVGLKNTVSWNNLMQSDRDNYDQVRQDFISNNSNCQ